MAKPDRLDDASSGVFPLARRMIKRMTASEAERDTLGREMEQQGDSMNSRMAAYGLAELVMDDCGQADPLRYLERIERQTFDGWMPAPADPRFMQQRFDSQESALHIFGLLNLLLAIEAQESPEGNRVLRETGPLQPRLEPDESGVRLIVPEALLQLAAKAAGREAGRDMVL